MGISTILPPARGKTADRVTGNEFSCLHRQPPAPLDLRIIANIERAVAQVGKGAMHDYRRLNNQAVFIPW
ncbi:hypothetical protein BMS3Abin01_01449 [bacterium BMS3Abin01]|nr:hypothetical protein BMS3Abin01_01449 [bacterium BMS3Abin01]HDZ59707.1 hypothetical protein [Actinomycetota bacterium]